MDEKYIQQIKKTALFENLDQDDLTKILDCLGVREHSNKKNEFLFYAGDKLDYFGIVLEGCYHIVRETYEGERVLINQARRGDYFAEAICCSSGAVSPVGIYAAENSVYLKIDIKKLLNSCTNACLFHLNLIENMIKIIANKNLILQSRIDFLSKKTIRTKLLAYFEALASKQGRDITIAYNREELADFLCIDRSAMSREMANLKKDGIIDYKLNKIKLL